MVTSKLPWTTSPHLQGTAILNEAGNVIGTFKDYRDAEHVVELVNSGFSYDFVEDLKQSLDGTRGELDTYESQVKELTADLVERDTALKEIVDLCTRALPVRLVS